MKTKINATWTAIFDTFSWCLLGVGVIFTAFLFVAMVLAMVHGKDVQLEDFFQFTMFIFVRGIIISLIVSIVYGFIYYHLYDKRTSKN